MLYRKDNKIYIKANSRFVEVDIKKDKTGYSVIPTKNKTEIYGRENEYFEISLEKAYELINKNSKFAFESKELEDKEL